MKLPADFDPEFYAASYPDVTISGMSPEDHYMLIGKKLCRPQNKDIAALSASHHPGQHSAHRSQHPFNMIWISGESDTPGHHYRVIRPIAAARSLGLEAQWIKPESVFEHINAIKRSHLLIIWRARWSSAISTAITTARESGAKIIFDVDDLMFAPEIARVSVVDGIRSQGLTEKEVRIIYSEIRQTMDHADLCIAPTEELATHMRRAGKPALVVPNTFDSPTRSVSRTARFSFDETRQDNLVRIGYASGSRTHQKDFALCADAVADSLSRHPECRLVLFRSYDHNQSILEISEFPRLCELQSQIEWRLSVTLEDLPHEIARFDINLAPLEAGNVFCEAKSELKFFEASLCRVPTIASPTGPFGRAISNGKSGLLASTPREWEDCLELLISSHKTRNRLGMVANCHVQWAFGPERLRHEISSLVSLSEDRSNLYRHFPFVAAARSHQLNVPPCIPDYEKVYSKSTHLEARATVMVTLFNYKKFVIEALESALAQTARPLDLVIVDDCSTDGSLETALSWSRANSDSFNRLMVVQTAENSGLGSARNLGFAIAETEWVMILDADNRLRPQCIERCLENATSSASFVYPTIQCFGAHSHLMSNLEWNPLRLIGGNYVDAMAMVARSAWAATGGYDTTRTGWEDYDLWCKLASLGLWGNWVPGEPLAEYRAHEESMMNTTMMQADKVASIICHLQDRHPWLNILFPNTHSST